MSAFSKTSRLTLAVLLLAIFSGCAKIVEPGLYVSLTEPHLFIDLRSDGTGVIAFDYDTDLISKMIRSLPEDRSKWPIKRERIVWQARNARLFFASDNDSLNRLMENPKQSDNPNFVAKVDSGDLILHNQRFRRKIGN